MTHSPCASCPYVLAGKVPTIIPGVGDTGGIFVCGEFPSPEDLRYKRPFSGVAGRMLDNAFHHTIPDEPLYYTYAVQCYVPGEPEPATPHIQACKQRVVDEITTVQPKITLALGNTAAHVLVDTLKRSETITKIRGKTFDTPHGKVLATFSPGYVTHRVESYKDFIKDIASLGEEGSPEVLENPSVTVITTVQDMNQLVARLERSGTTHAVCDLETTGLDETEADSRITCIGICFDLQNAYVITEEALKNPLIRVKLKLLLENAKYHWTNHNVFFDYHWLKEKFHIQWKAEFDTFLASYALDERRGTHGLKVLARDLFGADEYGKEAKENEFWRNPTGVGLDKLYWYCGLDVWYTYRLRPVLEAQLQKEGILSVHDDVLFPLAKALSEIERVGILLDIPYLEQQKVLLGEKIAELLGKLRLLAGDDKFNPASWLQIQKLLCDKWEILPPGSSTGVEVLELYRDKHEFIDILLEYRKYTKVLSTYVESLLEKHGSDKRIRPNFHVDGTRSGRISCVVGGTLVEIVRDVSQYPRGIPIEDVKIGDLAYTYTDDGVFTLRPVTAVFDNGYKEVIRVHWRTAGYRKGYIDLTPDHKVRLTDNTWKYAGDLQSGDRVLALSRATNPSHILPTFSKPLLDHRFIYEYVHGKLSEHVHHINGNHLDNRIENLLGMTASEHTSYHEKILRKTNPNWRPVITGPAKFNWLGLTRNQVYQLLENNSWSILRASQAGGYDFNTFKKYAIMNNIDLREMKRRNRALRKDQIYEAAKHARDAHSKKAKERKLVNNNHVILCIEKIPTQQHVYDITVDDTHKYIAGEICISNCSTPNLQNIPKDMGPLIRNAFIATPGWKFCEIDLSQAELRVLALRSGDRKLIQAFEDDTTDIHRQVASIMFKVPYDKVTPLQRKAGKTLGFAIIYGRGITSIASDLEESIENAMAMRKNFFDSMPRVQQYINERHRFVMENFYSETSFGRKRRFPCLI